MSKAGFSCRGTRLVRPSAWRREGIQEGGPRIPDGLAIKGNTVARADDEVLS